MSWSGRQKRPTAAQAKAFWSAELGEAASVAGTVRIACSPEDHAVIRAEASRIAQAVGSDVVIDSPTPRLLSVTFTARPGDV